MYKPQDIMIGDWLLYKGMPHCVVGIMDEHLMLNDHGAIFGGVVREPEISISITVMDVFEQEDYQKSWELYQFYPANKNNEFLSDFKKTVDQFLKDFDKE